MAKARSALRDRLEYLAVRIALASLSRLPRKAAFQLGILYAGALDRMVPRLRRVALENLAFAFPQLPAMERRGVADGVFRSIGRILATFARLPQINRGNVGQWIRCEGVEHVHHALGQGRGLIFATGHLGNWELSAFAFAMLEKPIHIVVRPLDNPLINTLVDRYRQGSGNRLIDKREYARGILQALSENQMIGILADQHVQDGQVIEFFGRPAATSAGIAKFAARTGAAVIPGFALWSEDEEKYVLRFLPPVEIVGEAQADTQRVQVAIEAMIRQYPDQWLWIHRRWKT